MRWYQGHVDLEMERLFKISLVLIVAAAFMRWDSPDEPPAVNQEMCESKSRAWVMAKVMVRQNLSRPEWVEFPNRASSSGLDGMSFQYLGDCRHRITAFVDARYRYSTSLVRRYFTVDLSYHGRSGWRLDQLDFRQPQNS